MLNMLGGVMGAFQQQVDDARQVGEQEGREAVQKDLEDMLNRARNDGYRDAMTYLDDRVTTAREAGAKEERARIANMGFFERRRYLKVHLTKGSIYIHQVSPLTTTSALPLQHSSGPVST